MKSYKNIYPNIISLENLTLAWRKARKGKTKKNYVLEFEQNLMENLFQLHKELKNQTYNPGVLKTFILRDPKTRKISKADFRDRVIHHAIINILEFIFDKTFIEDNCANRKNKGSLFAIKRFAKFQKKITNNLTSEAYCFKADIKHYFQEINHDILLNIIQRKIKDKKVIWLIKCIIERESQFSNGKGMPLGNLTSQFFANVYLNKLDQFVKHKLKIKYYIRYVDDFVILSKSKEQLKIWRGQIQDFLIKELKLVLHPEKSRVINLSMGIDFVGFRNFYYYKLLRKRNVRNMERKIKLFNECKIDSCKFLEIFQGWQAYAKWANSHNLTNKIIKNLSCFLII